MRSTSAVSMRSISALTCSMSAQSSGLRGAMRLPSRGRNDCVGLDLNEPVGIDEARHFEDARRRADVAEHLAMHAADNFPMGNVHEIDARADHVLESCARILQRLADNLEDGAGLRRGIADADHLPAATRGGTPHGDGVADAHRARKADDRLIGASRGHVNPLAHRPDRMLIHAALLHQSCGLTNGPAASSMARAVRNNVSSSNGRPISCKPSGVPSDERPAGTDIPGSPAMLTVTVKMSFRYISTGSPDFSPSAKAGDGVVGVRITSTS